MTAPIADGVVDVLAVHRLTRLIVEDRILDDARTAWFERHDPATTKLGYLVTCPWCTGFWVSAAAVAARAAAPRIWGTVARVLALSSAAGILYTRSTGQGW